MTHVDVGTITLPPATVLQRVTPTFTEETVPVGLLGQHRIAEEVHGRLVVHEGALSLVFEDEPELVTPVQAGEAAVIPPGRPHHVELDGPVRFAIEFYVWALT